MKKKSLIVLLLVNVLLLGVGWWFFNHLFAQLEQMAHPNTASGIRERLKAGKSNGTSHLTEPKKPQGGAAYVTNRFHWSQVESSDYQDYIANLRSIGCPEATIKDIILTDIMRLYAARRGQFYHNGRDFKFWETNEKRKLSARQLEERERQLAAIDKEIPAVLRELLGINYEREINKYFVDSNEDDRRLGFLSEDKRSRVLALREQIEGMRERALENAAGGILTEVEREALQKIEKERRSELAKILTPSELEEFDLRTSETAERLREQLIGFNPSEEEFRQLYLVQKALDEKFAFASASDGDIPVEKEAEQAKIDEEIRGKLGEARYAEYLRARNPDYRSACLFTELYELPQSTATSIFEIQQIAQREKQNLLSNRNIPEDRRFEALQAIRAETEQSLLQILGTKLLSNYSQSSGKWIQDLGSAN